MAAEVVELAMMLIDIESISGSELAMADFLENYLQAKGWQVTRQSVAAGRDNIYAHRPGRLPKLLFNSHIDTVPPFFPASRDDTWIRGRGACDTKSLIAAQLLAAQALADEGLDQIGLLYVVGEEVDHCGMIKANELGLDLFQTAFHQFIKALTGRLENESIGDQVKLLYHLASLLEGGLEEPQELAALMLPLLR